MARRGIAALLIGGIFLLAGLAAIGAGLYAMGSDLAFAARAETVEGQVEGMRTERRRRSRVHVADLHFVTRAGQEVRTPAIRPNSWMRQAAGDTVLVRYDPADPVQASLEPLVLRLLGAAIALPFGALFAAFGWTIAVGPPRWPAGVFLGAAAALVLLVALLVAANEVEEALATRRGTAFATGEVIGHRTMTQGGAGVMLAPRFRFTTADGRSVVAEPPIWSSRPDPATGTAVTLRYRRDRPEQAAPDRGALLMWLRPAAALALPVLLAAGGILLLRRFRRRPPAQPRRA